MQLECYFHSDNVDQRIEGRRTARAKDHTFALESNFMSAGSKSTYSNGEVCCATSQEKQPDEVSARIHNLIFSFRSRDS